ncbi:MAG: hypothetical protein J1D77_04130 [Muribaculaceae bacterium]|nr:hypothetical protein [Muribaculaceae bacterium]
MNLISNITRSLKRLALAVAPLWAALLALSSCSSDLDIDKGLFPGSEEIVIQFAIPDLKSVLTRATSEAGIEKIDAFLFTEDGQFIAKENYSITPQLAQQKVLLRVGGAYSNKNVVIYLVANGGSNVESINSLEGLRRHILDTSLQDPDYLPMIGKVTVNTAETETSLTLTRSVAKVSAECSMENVEVEGIRIYNNAVEGFLASSINRQEYDGDDYVISTNVNTGTPADGDFNNQPNTLYTYPSYGFNYNEKTGAYVIVKVKRDGTDQYYRLNLRKEKTSKDSDADGYIDTANGLIYLNLFPNHHYKIKITGFFTDGYPSAEEASKHPEADQFIVYNIHDHAMEVLSMVTDGYNELGVTPEVTLNSSVDEKTVVVKCFSPDRVVTENEIEWVASEGLQVVYAGPHKYKLEDGEVEDDGTENPFVADYNERWDPDNPGQQFEFTVKIAQGTKEYENLDGEVTFKWNGLERKVKVNFEAAFLLPDVCTVTLKIFENGTKLDATIRDYWTFVTAQGESGEKEGLATSADLKGQTPRLFGIKPQNMVGNKKRMNGFHFPMPYGEQHSSNPWTYVYTVDFTNLTHQADIEGKTIERIEDIKSGDSFFTDCVNWSYSSGNSGELTFNQTGLSDPYQYGGGTITFVVKYTDGTESLINASLYHTGFFHYEGETAYAPENKLGYYYYEVVPMAGSYWLDRNIGAEANTSYIDIEDPIHNTGSEAAGRLFTIIEEPQPFKLPKWDFNMIPPGYHVPNQIEWDDLRLHDNFVTQSVTLNSTLYMSTYYRTDNSKIGNIYFQKARFRNNKNLYLSSPKYNEEANSGDAGAGYYWSVSEAPAMEKEQMGNWLRALYLNGSSSTFNNASVTDHRMPIRCKAGTDQEKKEVPENYISFNVHEVTHVFLYHKDNLTPLFTFPGRAVGSSASAVKWQHFYCSTTQDPSNLRMIFVKLQEDGKVMLHYKDGDTFKSTQEFDKINLKTQGWNIDTGKYYDFCEVGQNRDSCVFTATADPTDCNTGSSSGDNQGGGGDSGDSGSTINPSDYQFTIEDLSKEENLNITRQEYIYGDAYGQYRMNSFNGKNFADLKPGSVLRIYTVVYSDGYKVVTRDSWWWELATYKASDTREFHPDNGASTEWIIEITLTQELINQLKEHPEFVLECNQTIILGMTLDESNASSGGGDSGGGGNTEPVPEGPSTEIWNGSPAFSNNEVTLYDFPNYSGNVILYFTYDITNQWYMAIRLNIENGPYYGYDSSDKSLQFDGTFKITLSESDYQQCRNNGLKITQDGISITSISVISIN